MYRKLKPTTIFTGRELLEEGKVLIATEQGHIEAIVDFADAGDNIQPLEGILSPGFINAHCHLELSYLKGVVPEETGLVQFVQEVMARRAVPGEKKLEAMQKAVAEMTRGGIVAVGDICNDAGSVPVKLDSPLYWRNFVEISGFINATAQKRLETSTAFLAAFRMINGIRSSAVMSPHSPYSVSRELFRLLNEATAGEIISIHNQESVAENELYSDKSGGFLNLYEQLGIDINDFTASGKSSLQTWLPYFNKGQQVISVHNSYTSQEDLDFVRSLPSVNLYYCLCPNANLYIENILPPVELLVKNDCKLVLGTDSYASNHQLSIMEEINTIRANFPSIPLVKILQWATLNGALALGIDHTYGSFERGRMPGFVLINNNVAQNIGPA